jgi:uncharacterized membrane protein
MTLIRKIFSFYFEGFTSMSKWGRKVWIVIMIKLFIMFAILKVFFFSDFLNTRFKSDSERSEYVREQIINSK